MIRVEVYACPLQRVLEHDVLLAVAVITNITVLVDSAPIFGCQEHREQRANVLYHVRYVLACQDFPNSVGQPIANRVQVPEDAFPVGQDFVQDGEPIDLLTRLGKETIMRYTTLHGELAEAAVMYEAFKYNANLLRYFSYQKKKDISYWVDLTETDGMPVLSPAIAVGYLWRRH